MERFTSEFLCADEPAEALRLAEQWIDPDITLYFAGRSSTVARLI